MRQTLFFIPHELASVPVFGFGWLLAVAVIACGATFAHLVKRDGWTSETMSFLPFAAAIALIIAFVLPLVEVAIQGHEQAFMLWQYQPEPETLPSGLPIRGYGIFLLIATVSGVMLARLRAMQVGLSPDAIYNLAFYMFVGGILGARVFYIIQYWHELHDPNSLVVTLKNMVNFVEGGLVVYGSLIGGLVAAIIFLMRNGLPVLPVADLIAPSLALGLAIGRIGCLMNGCCFGGVCDHGWAITFPQQSPVYYHQQSNGSFFGFTLGAGKDGAPTVALVIPHSQAERSGMKPGDSIESVGGVPTPTLESALAAIGSTRTLVVETSDKRHSLSIPVFPEKALPVHPTQLYSSLNALLLAGLTFGVFPYRRRDGEVFALLICGYAITRFLLEVIRTDEGSFSQTGMTISQNVSVGMLVGVAALAIYLGKQPRGTFWPTPGLNIEYRARSDE